MHLRELPVHTGRSKVQKPAFIRIPSFCQRRRCVVFTRKTHRTPENDDTDASGRFRESRLAHKMHTGPLTEQGDHHLVVTLDSCPFTTERRTCWPVSTVHWAVLGSPITAVVSEGRRLAPCVCAEPVIPYHWPPWFLVVIHQHREDTDLRIPCLFFP